MAMNSISKCVDENGWITYTDDNFCNSINSYREIQPGRRDDILYFITTNVILLGNLSFYQYQRILRYIRRFELVSTLSELQKGYSIFSI